MKVFNLTPHSVEVYDENQFLGLTSPNPFTNLADGVEGEPIASYPSVGNARMSVTKEKVESELPFPTYRSQYGELVGIPENIGEDDILIVSLPLKGMANEIGHPLAKQMVSPDGVVRSTSNGSLVLGCMGLSF